ncbi:MAG TPA: TIGR01777 family oxidoreductase [Terracidiphilus sp.]|nr:TIGR01777 family oxidoreductase [Terracidiphilus sp.]
MEKPERTNRPLRIVLPGGSGQVGRMLAAYFQQRGHHVTVLTRGPYAASWQTVHWDGATLGPWVETLEGADVVIHLSGRSVNCRYTAKNRRELYDSRIGPTRLLHRAFAKLDNPPWLWMNASTATIYRHQLDRDMDEETGEIGGGEWIGSGIWRRRAPKKWDWTVGLVKAWESAFFDTPTPRTRKIALRTSLVFSPAPGSVFALMSRMARVGLGGTQGDGRQYVSWIHEADYARAIEFLIEHESMAGPVNLTAPNPLPNREFQAALREAWGMPNGLPAPAPLLALGMWMLRAEPELVLKSRRVVPQKLLDAGFRFRFPSWPEAAEDLVRQWREAAS